MKNKKIELRKKSQKKTKQYQQKISKKLESIFTNCLVEMEWPAFKRTDGIYAPRIDIAVGPFAIHNREISRYDDLIERHKDFIVSCQKSFIKNMQELSSLNNIPLNLSEIYNFNRNARCFMAIEIERSGSRKHLLGDIINVSTLGRIGIIIPWNDDLFKAFIRQIDYLSFLKSVGKNTLAVKNLIILTRRQFNRIINKYPSY